MAGSRWRLRAAMASRRTSVPSALARPMKAATAWAPAENTGPAALQLSDCCKMTVLLAARTWCCRWGAQGFKTLKDGRLARLLRAERTQLPQQVAGCCFKVVQQPLQFQQSSQHDAGLVRQQMEAAARPPHLQAPQGR